MGAETGAIKGGGIGGGTLGGGTGIGEGGIGIEFPAFATTILQQPQEFLPAYNYNAFVVTSTNNTLPSFKYVAVIILNGDTSNPIIEKSSPHPVYGSAYFNPARMTESLVKYDINNFTYGFDANENTISTYYIDFYEEFEWGGEIVLNTHDKISSNEVKIWNGIIDYYNYQSYNCQNYLIDYGVILNHTLPRDVRMNDNGWIYYLASDVASLYQNIQVNAYDSAGGLLASTVLQNPFQDDTILANHSIRFDCCPNGLNEFNAAHILSGSQPIIPPTTAYYEIDFDINPNLLLRFNIVEDNCKYETFRLHYQNNLGAFESFNFMLASKHTENIKREKYKGIVGGLQDAEYFGYNISDRSTTNFFTIIKDTYKVRTNWLSEEYKEVLEQLVSSPVVYWEKMIYPPTSSSPIIQLPYLALVPIDIVNTNYEFDQKVTKRNFNLEIDFELSHDRYRQRN